MPIFDAGYVDTSRSVISNGSLSEERKQDESGRSIKIDYGISGYIDLEGIRDLKPTLFSKHGNNIFFILILLYIVLTFSFNRTKNE